MANINLLLLLNLNTKAFCINLESRSINFYIEILENLNDGIVRYRFLLYSNKFNENLKTRSLLVFINNNEEFNEIQFYGKGVIEKYEILNPQDYEYPRNNIVEDDFGFDLNRPNKRYLHLFEANCTPFEMINDEPRLIKHFDFSIPDIRLNSNTKKYFNSIKKIKLDDYLNIIDNNFFISRTMFAKIINALPYENRQELSMEFQRVFFPKKKIIPDYMAALEILRDFIVEKIYTQGNLLINTYKIASESNIEHFKSINLGFRRDNDPIMDKKEFDNLAKQSKRFEALFKYDNSGAFWKEIFNQIDKNKDSEYRYNTRFSKLQWPIKEI